MILWAEEPGVCFAHPVQEPRGLIHAILEIDKSKIYFYPHVNCFKPLGTAGTTTLLQLTGLNV